MVNLYLVVRPKIERMNCFLRYLMKLIRDYEQENHSGGWPVVGLDLHHWLGYSLLYCKNSGPLARYSIRTELTLS